MDVKTLNELLARGEVDREDMWPRIVEMEAKALQFRFEFGLNELPKEPGLITIRGPRQYGKSTWLDMNLRRSVRDHGKGSAFYLNGDELTSAEDLVREMTAVHSAFSPQSKVKRLFIDEITAIPEWEKSVKRLVDQGLFRDVLIVSTGSKATDLRRGSERLPGRKGKLARSEYIFLPISYREFQDSASRRLKENTWKAYLLTGGSPLALNDIYQFDHLPDYFLQLTRDWVTGEIVQSGRSRVSLTQLLHVLFRFGGQAVGYAKLARESGLANNTVAAGYIEQLSDLLCVMPAWAWEPNNKTLQMRKPCKFHFINLAAVVAFHPSAPRTVHEFDALPPDTQGQFLEWLVAQEIWRRSVLAGRSNPEALGYWASKEHGIDFVTPSQEFIEVKRGRAGPLDFAWFEKVFPKSRLTIVCDSPFQSRKVTGLMVEEFLLSEPSAMVVKNLSTRGSHGGMK